MHRVLPAVVAFALSACGPSDPAAVRAAEVQDILEAHLRHQDALLDILEKNMRDPDTAEAQLAAYLARNDEAIRQLSAKRLELEVDQRALATALHALEPEMKRSFERRMALAEKAPELISRDKVRTALATLDPL